MKNIFSIVLSLLACVNCFTINVYEQSVLTIKYVNNYSYPINVFINNNKYRESSLQPLNEGVYSVFLKKGSYDILFTDIVNYKYNLEKALKITDKKDDLKSIMYMKNKWSILKSYNFLIDKNEYIKISSMINFEILDKQKKINYNIKIFINKNIIYDSLLNKKTFSFISKKILLIPNYYNIIFKIKPINNILCSCTTSNNGFEYGRHFTLWKINKYRNEKFTTNIIVKNLLNLEENNNINNINNKYIKYILSI